MDRVGSRASAGARTRVVTNGATNGAVANGLRAKANGATTHRPGTNGTAKVEPVVRLSHVKKTFGKTAVLTEINLSVAPGELVEITGPSGAGKTTLLRLVHGQLRPNDGEVWVEGRGLHAVVGGEPRDHHRGDSVRAEELRQSRGALRAAVSGLFERALNQLSAGDVLMVTRLDRLAVIHADLREQPFA